MPKALKPRRGFIDFQRNSKLSTTKAFKKDMTKESKEMKEISPSQYFDYLKGAKQQVTTDALKESFEVFVSLAEKYRKTGQVDSIKRLCFLADTLTKEEKVIELGINTFIYKDTIEDYIENVANKTVKIIELSRYMREVPDEICEVVEKTKDLFDNFYVVFTDYTGKEERKTQKERRDKDPILFGVFRNNTSVADRFYFLGDWIDEYCDLTLDKLVEEYKNKKSVSPVVPIEVPKTSGELVDILKTYMPDENSGEVRLTSNLTDGSAGVSVTNYLRSTEKKKGFFEKVRSIFRS